MTQFEPSAHAYLAAQLDKHNDINLEYWSKQNEIKTN